MQQQFQATANQHGVQGVGSSNLLAPTNGINDLRYHTVSKRSTVYKPKANSVVAFFLFLIVLLTGCGGSGGGTPAISQQSAPSFTVPTSTDKSIVFEGDSLTWLWAETTWPTTVMNDLAWPNTVWNDVAISGTTTAEMLARYDANVHPLRPHIFGNGIFIINGGTNDFCHRLNDDVVAYANLVAIWAKARADGFRVVATTVRSSCDVAGGGWEAYRINLNAKIRSNPALYDRLVPLDTTALVTVDGTHYTPADNAIVAAMVEAVLAGM